MECISKSLKDEFLGVVDSTCSLSSCVNLYLSYVYASSFGVSVVDDKKWNEKHPDKEPRVKVCAKELMNIQEAKLISAGDTEKWLEELEKKELPVMKELKDGLTDLGADKDDYDSITGFAKALEHPVKSSTGKVFVEIPNPEKTLPVLKKVMKKLTSVIEKTKEIGRKIAGHAQQTRVSLRAKLAEAQEEARRQNEERKPVQKKNDIAR